MLDMLNEKAVKVLQGDVVEGIVISYQENTFLASKDDKVICKCKSMTVFFNEMYSRRLIKK